METLPPTANIGRLRVSLDRAVTSMAGALDFVGIDEVNHGQRVGLIAESIAGTLGWDLEQRRRMLYLGFLHDCGVSRMQEHRRLTETLEWDGAEQHCIRGERFLRDCPPLARYAAAVRWHHTRWKTLSTLAENPQTRLESNLVFLADRLDVLLARYIEKGQLRNDILVDGPRLIDRLGTYSGTLFSPELVTALAEAATRESFWLQCDPCYMQEEISERIQNNSAAVLDAGDARSIAMLFARIVDSKSVYTFEHSTRVAAIVRHMGAVLEIKGEHLLMLEIAALLHDIGKLRVPEEIIDKPGPISDQERAIVKRHSYDTGRILKRVFPGLPISQWAALHHENLLGSGYPRQVEAAEIPMEARLIAVADVFQAMSQQRPYRGQLSAETVITHLESLAADGRMDPSLTQLFRNHLHDVYRIATQGTHLPVNRSLSVHSGISG